MSVDTHEEVVFGVANVETEQVRDLTKQEFARLMGASALTEQPSTEQVEAVCGPMPTPVAEKPFVVTKY
jgi:hypothetical protein